MRFVSCLLWYDFCRTERVVWIRRLRRERGQNFPKVHIAYSGDSTAGTRKVWEKMKIGGKTQKWEVVFALFTLFKWATRAIRYCRRFKKSNSLFFYKSKAKKWDLNFKSSLLVFLLLKRANRSFVKTREKSCSLILPCCSFKKNDRSD